MIGKFFKEVFYLLSIGLLQYVALGCQTNSDCLTGTTTGSRKECCYNADPPRCMDWLTCYLSHKDDYKPTPFRFTVPDYDRFTVPHYDRFTVPDYDKIPNINVPTFSFDNNNNNNYDYNDSNHSSGDSSGATVATVISVVCLTILITCFRWIRYRSSPSRVQGNCSVPPPAPVNTIRVDLVAENEEPSRIIIIPVTRDEDHDGYQNRPPDGEPPFLSEEDILSNFHSCAQKPPSYEESLGGPHSPQDQGLDNPAMNQPPPPTYYDLPATATPSPNVNPPTYQEALVSNN